MCASCFNFLAHISQWLVIYLFRACRGRTDVWFPVNSCQMRGVKLVLKGVASAVKSLKDTSFPIHWPTVMPWCWAPIRTNQLSMAATAHVIWLCACVRYMCWPGLHRRKMSPHALLKMTRDLFRAMSLALRQKYPRNVVEMKEAMAAFFGSDSVAISCHCKRSKIIFIKV